ncbi:flavin reductase family protein [uncultured Selenomonas sp.]|uniref:flavin reductase family protein n=1 Tax=uncultured Selenomonas sp. TaxID=159275 RepID=UPI0025D55A20|nr:flavin reductase family protein [uncultured Selenomonas sp.]
MKEQIDVLANAKEILESVKTGVLLVTKDGEKVNAMTISWGALGIDWRHPTFTTYVRESRFTKGLLDKTGVFNIAIGAGEQAKKVLGVCGSKSGRDMDKVKECGLTLVEPEVNDVPAIQEFPLTLECKVVFKQQKDPMAMTRENREQFYPETDGKRDNHIIYEGEIVAAYRVK